MSNDVERIEREERAERLKWARIKAEFGSAAKAAARFQWNPNTYKAHESGRIGFPMSQGREYARRLGVSFSWLMTGEGSPDDRDKVPVVGTVGGGKVVFPIDDHAQGAGLGEVGAPPDRTAFTVAVRVTGDSMATWNAGDGAILYYDQRYDPPEPHLIGRLCIVWCEDERVLVKRLLPGSESGLWSLQSSDGSLERDVAVKHAAEVTFIKPA